MSSAPTSPRLHLVFGASGYIGTNLVPRLLAAGFPVRATSRRPEVLEARDWAGVDICRADALDPTTLPTTLKDVDTAYYLVHSMAAGREFGRLDLEAAANFAAAAAAAGVRRIVYLGGLVPDEADSEHIVSRRDTGNALRRGSVPVTEVRAGIIVGPGSAAFEVMRDLVFHLPVMITPRWVRSQSPPIALDNLLEYLLRLPDIDEAAGGVYDAAGPETLTYEQMMGVLADVAGRRPPRIVPVPMLSPKLSSYWLKFVTAVPTRVARALIEGLKHDFYADSGPLRRLVPQDLLDFRSSVEAVFAAERRSDVQARWVEGAFAMRQSRIDYAYYAKRAGGAALSTASLASLWQVVSSIGGNNRYYYLNSLWAIREWIDWLVGGPGLKRGRRHATELRVGDHVDSWEVIGVEPERRLTLAFGMRAPGAGVLEFEIVPTSPQHHRVRATAYWHPAGVSGLLYWYALEPAHQVIFKGLTREICERAEALDRQHTDAS
ncbi:MAG: SDR family oxidoreductase [Gammaproteobacteria bacterium]|jgi:uncharacterized protein YbjT (DUF2867 family)